jgi:hypothetical protein
MILWAWRKVVPSIAISLIRLSNHKPRSQFRL